MWKLLIAQARKNDSCWLRKTTTTSSQEIEPQVAFGTRPTRVHDPVHKQTRHPNHSSSDTAQHALENLATPRPTHALLCFHPPKGSPMTNLGARRARPQPSTAMTHARRGGRVLAFFTGRAPHNTTNVNQARDIDDDGLALTFRHPRRPADSISTPIRLDALAYSRCAPTQPLDGKGSGDDDEHLGSTLDFQANLANGGDEEGGDVWEDYGVLVDALDSRYNEFHRSMCYARTISAASPSIPTTTTTTCTYLVHWPRH
ncbi:hypothetical protein DFP72DRAFT_902441 [Ephemerocybe angulata]|uniref:Uncharacterized protein n=1 Tax=Ephemerocybe angulata TaxID=980116 RepID=A0A8H6M5U3_9AGAR|nr:hypothetical protein DFP72DRAFT_902441 [Tulosesus angulatus]